MKRVFGIILAVLFALALTFGFICLGIVSGFSVPLSILLALGIYAATAVLGGIVWLIMWLLYN